MKNFILFLVFTFILLLTSCKDKTTDPTNTLYLTSISPTSATVGSTIMVTGKSFGVFQDGSYVEFNSIKVSEIISWSDTLIILKVPIVTSSCKVTVTVDNVKSNKLDFIVITGNTLKITSVIPVIAKIGDQVTISGTVFGSTQLTGFVSFNELKAPEVLSWNDSIITVKVPEGATSGKLSITVNNIKSNELDFTVQSIESDTITTVKIGTQVWMKYNLNVDHFRNGDPIPQVRGNLEWFQLNTSAWCYYDNDPANGEIYGKLYNWFSLNDPRGLAPKGWHVPSFSEWEVLINYLGGVDVAGMKMKETGIAHWPIQNSKSTNESGFTALAAGNRIVGGTFEDLNCDAYIWSTTPDVCSGGYYLFLYYNDTKAQKCILEKICGASVRCIKD